MAGPRPAGSAEPDASPSPGDEPGPERSRLHYAIMAIGAVVGGVLIGSLVGALIAVPFVLAGSPSTAVVPLVIAVEVGYGVVGAGYLALRAGGLRRHLGLPSPQAVAASVVVALVFVGLGQALLAPLPGVGLGELTNTAGRESIPPTTLLALAPVGLFVIGPAEELLFRGAAQQLLAKAFSARAAILGASVLFVLVHAGTVVQAGVVGLAPLSVIAVLSVVLGWTYERTGTLVVPALLHGVYDAALFVLAYAVTVGLV